MISVQVIKHGDRSGMANVQLQTPERFDFKNPDAWLSWKRRFEQFRIASGLSKTDEARQISMLIVLHRPRGRERVRFNQYHFWPAKKANFFGPTLT